MTLPPFERQFPIHPTDRHKLPSVPWSFVAPHERQAIKNHDQTLNTLAERGGLGLCELLAVVTGRGYYDVPIQERTDAEDHIRKMLEDHKA